MTGLTHTRRGAVDTVDHRLYSNHRVRELSFRRPPVNAFDAELLTMLNDSIAGAEESGIGALVLSGRGGIFSAGLDLKAAARLSHDDIARTFALLRDVTLAIGNSSIPIACAVTGDCLGAGAIFSLLCDYRVMNRQARRFGITEVRGGMTIGRHVIHALARIVGEHRAQQLILEARVLDAQQAQDLGLADELADPRFVVSRAVAWCDRMLKLPRRAMVGARAGARAGLRRVLLEVEAEQIDDRVREWFDDDVQASLHGLLVK